MSKAAVFRSLLSGDKREAWFVVFDALMSPEKPDLQESIDLLKEEADQWPDDFRYGLEGLQAYRDYYEERAPRLNPKQAQQYEEYDEEWTLELLDQMHRRKYGVPRGETPDLEIDNG